MKSILDRSFQYTPSAKTDIRKTFARVRRERKAQEQGQTVAAAPDQQEEERQQFVRPFLISSN